MYQSTGYGAYLDSHPQHLALILLSFCTLFVKKFKTHHTRTFFVAMMSYSVVVCNMVGSGKKMFPDLMIRLFAIEIESHHCVIAALNIYSKNSNSSL